MFAYCRNSPIFRVDAQGFEDFACNDDKDDDIVPGNNFGSVTSGNGSPNGSGNNGFNKVNTNSGNNTLSPGSQSRSSGSYEIQFKSGKNYVGKGSEARMRTSANQHSRANDDPVVSMSLEYAPDTRTAYINEYFKMAVRGVGNPNTYNKIWSPGRTMYIHRWG